MKENVVLNSFHLFCGAGGGVLADILLGHTTVGAVEIETYPRKVLLARQLDGSIPRFPIWDDVKTFRVDNPDTRSYIEWLQKQRNELVICGGFPCQAFSTAARGRNVADNLWPEMFRIVSDVAPRYVFAENVSINAILEACIDLESLGYKTRCVSISARDMGADHIRERHWLLAYADNDCKLSSTIDAKAQKLSELGKGIWQDYPESLRMADGMAHRMDRLTATGNGQVSIAAATAFYALIKGN